MYELALHRQDLIWLQLSDFSDKIEKTQYYLIEFHNQRTTRTGP